MTQKEVVELVNKYQGQMVRIPKGGGPKSPHKGRIIGYSLTDKSILVETVKKFKITDIYNKYVVDTPHAGYPAFQFELVQEAPKASVPQVTAKRAAKVIPHYPHKCTRCGSSAYIGAFSVDCSNKNCGVYQQKGA